MVDFAEHARMAEVYAKEMPVLRDPIAAVHEEAEWYDRFVLPLENVLGEIEGMMVDRHRKYGPGNIAKHGTVGIHVRMDDKFSRLEAGQGNFDDETIENTLDDIIGYALIWKLWIRGHWPGSEK